jgi:hypothetical protein
MRIMFVVTLMLAVGGSVYGDLPEQACGAGEGAQVEPVEPAAAGGPGAAGGGLDDPDEQQRQPAEDDVGADAFFEPVIPACP